MNPRHRASMDKSIPIVKLVSLGDSGVGKTQFLQVINDARPDDAPPLEMLPKAVPTIGVDFLVSVWTINEHRFRIQMWDTAGSERYRAMATTQYLRGCEIVLLFFDITSASSFEHVKTVWLDMLNEHRKTHGFENVTAVLVGNKCDLHEARVLSTDEAERFARQNDMLYIESTAYRKSTVIAVVQTAMENVSRLHITNGCLADRSLVAAKEKLELQKHERRGTGGCCK